jgi:hypothetical protein
MEDQIIKDILDNQNEILSNIKDESVRVYLFLKDEYKKGDVKNNTLFQFVFKSFYKLNIAGLGEDLPTYFFKLLANKKDDLEYILLELYEIPTLNAKNKNTIQFSFATKLLHTLDNNKPIFDSEVSDVIDKRRTGRTKEEKIKSCIEIYKGMRPLYLRLLESKVKEVIEKFRIKFEVDESKISDIKALDFIIWSLGKIKRK